MHYIDEGPRDAKPVLLLHGEPSWSYLYRKMIPPIVAAGHRVIAPDLIGFGRSDKPSEQSDYTFQTHMDWLTSFLTQLDLQRHHATSARTGAASSACVSPPRTPTATSASSSATAACPPATAPRTMPSCAGRSSRRRRPSFPIGKLIQGATVTELPAEVEAAYDAPFPDDTYKAGARIFPSLVPTTPDDPAAPANRKAWETLQKWEKPFLTCFSDSDPVTKGGERDLQTRIPGAQGQPHVMIEGGGHFLQEDKGEELGKLVVDFIASTS